MLKDFLSLIYPPVCASCEGILMHNENLICTHCLYRLPKTNYHYLQDNPVARLFWGRADIAAAAAMFTFSKGGKIQHLIHQLKYRNQKEIGKILGHFYGNELKQTDLFKDINMVVPVPLHLEKIKKRGYNQSSLFAEGIAKSMQIECSEKIIFRNTFSETQTRKSRYKRWQNVETIFETKNNFLAKGKHILIVDDVVTTGSTLEACAQTLLKIPNTTVSIAAIAFAAL
ncbi:MAG: ComF family protein [Bacteroidia bacterium]